MNLKRIFAGTALATALLVPFAGTAEAKTPYVSKWQAKAEASQVARSFVRERFDSEIAWNDSEATVNWDDYDLSAPRCYRRSRSTVDCSVRVRLYESDESDSSRYTTGEDCRWWTRTRNYGVWHGSKHVSTVTRSTGQASDWNPVKCADM
jgi:hypothetical protein